MIITNEKEMLNNLGTKNVSLRDLTNRADEMSSKWHDTLIEEPVRLTPDGSVIFGGDTLFVPETKADITEYAFGQICNTVGVPAGYIRKCLDNHLEDLAISNYDTWANMANRGSRIIRTYNGAVHAQVTNRYNVFDHSDVMHGIMDALDSEAITGNYEANQAFMSPDKLHIRFVDFDHPIQTAGDTLHAGFTINSNNVGSGAFSVKYFIYRFACRNGIVRVSNGGTLFRQTHLNSFREISSELFRDVLSKVDHLNEQTKVQIEKAAKHQLNELELDQNLTKAQRDLHFGTKGKEKIIELMNSIYDHSYWGLINSITESAQDYTLETRLEMEEWAGKQLVIAGRMAA